MSSEFSVADELSESAQRALQGRHGLQLALLAGGLLLEIPRVITRYDLMPASLGRVAQDIGTTRLTGRVGASAVDRSGQVNDRAAGRDRDADAACQVRGRHELEAVDPRVVARAAVRIKRLVITACDVLHAAALDGRILQWHPDRDRLEIARPFAAESIVLVPRRCSAVQGRLEDGVFEIVLRLATLYLLRDGFRTTRQPSLP